MVGVETPDSVALLMLELVEHDGDRRIVEVPQQARTPTPPASPAASAGPPPTLPQTLLRPGRSGRLRQNGRARRDPLVAGEHPSLRAAPPPPRRGVPHARTVPARSLPPPTLP